VERLLGATAGRLVVVSGTISVGNEVAWSRCRRHRSLVRRELGITYSCEEGTDVLPPRHLDTSGGTVGIEALDGPVLERPVLR